MRVLAIETSTAACSVALSCGDRIFEDNRIEPRQHNRLLLSMIQGVLKAAHLKLADLDLIGFSRGPGSFTGLRIGASVALGLAAPGHTPLVAVSTLEVLSATGLVGDREPGSAASVDRSYPGALAVLESRPGEIYLGVYRVQEQALMPEREDSVMSRQEAQLPAGYHDWLLVDGMAGGASNLPLASGLESMVCLPKAARLAELAILHHARASKAEVRDLDLFYPRGSSPWKKIR